MSVKAQVYDIQADVYTWWSEEFVFKSGGSPIDLTGKTIELILADGTVLTEGSGLEIEPEEGKIVTGLYVEPKHRGSYRLNIKGEGAEPKVTLPETPLWGKFEVLGPPQ